MPDTNRPLQEWEAGGGGEVARAVAGMTAEQRVGPVQVVEQASRDGDARYQAVWF